MRIPTLEFVGVSADPRGRRPTFPLHRDVRLCPQAGSDAQVRRPGLGPHWRHDEEPDRLSRGDIARFIARCRAGSRRRREARSTPQHPTCRRPASQCSHRAWIHSCARPRSKSKSGARSRSSPHRFPTASSTRHSTSRLSRSARSPGSAARPSAKGSVGRSMIPAAATPAIIWNARGSTVVLPAASALAMSIGCAAEPPRDSNSTASSFKSRRPTTISAAIGIGTATTSFSMPIRITMVGISPTIPGSVRMLTSSIWVVDRATHALRRVIHGAGFRRAAGRTPCRSNSSSLISNLHEPRRIVHPQRGATNARGRMSPLATRFQPNTSGPSAASGKSCRRRCVRRRGGRALRARRVSLKGHSAPQHRRGWGPLGAL